MEWIEKPNQKLNVNGVTNHRNGVSSTTPNSNPKRQDLYGPLLPGSVASTLLKSSHKGYGGADGKILCYFQFMLEYLRFYLQLNLGRETRVILKSKRMKISG